LIIGFEKQEVSTAAAEAHSHRLGTTLIKARDM
jgi:hypothetical protein